jgi:hypothetical protein
MLAWTMAAELPKVPLADGLELLLFAHDVEPARFDRAVPRWHAQLCREQQLSSGEAQLALAALNALPGPGVQSAVQSLAAVARRAASDGTFGCCKPGSVAADDAQLRPVPFGLQDRACHLPGSSSKVSVRRPRSNIRSEAFCERLAQRSLLGVRPPSLPGG